MLEARKLALRAIGAWGPLAQMGMVQEECAELIAAINQRRRGRLEIEDLAEEVADIEITMESLRIIVGDNLVDQKKQEKLYRLETRLLLAESEKNEGVL